MEATIDIEFIIIIMELYGADGSDGADDSDGADYSDGADGSDGVDGSDGADGAFGANWSELSLSFFRGCNGRKPDHAMGHGAGFLLKNGGGRRATPLSDPRVILLFFLFRLPASSFSLIFDRRRGSLKAVSVPVPLSLRLS